MRGLSQLKNKAASGLEVKMTCQFGNNFKKFFRILQLFVHLIVNFYGVRGFKEDIESLTQNSQLSLKNDNTMTHRQFSQITWKKIVINRSVHSIKMQNHNIHSNITYAVFITRPLLKCIHIQLQKYFYIYKNIYIYTL